MKKLILLGLVALLMGFALTACSEYVPTNGYEPPGYEYEALTDEPYYDCADENADIPEFDEPIIAEIEPAPTPEPIIPPTQIPTPQVPPTQTPTPQEPTNTPLPQTPNNPQTTVVPPTIDNQQTPAPPPPPTQNNPPPQQPPQPPPPQNYPPNSSGSIEIEMDLIGGNEWGGNDFGGGGSTNMCITCAMGASDCCLP